MAAQALSAAACGPPGSALQRARRPQPTRVSEALRGRQDGWTPLHYAARSGRAEVVRALVQAGADTAARTKVRGRPCACDSHPLTPRLLHLPIRASIPHPPT